MARQAAASARSVAAVIGGGRLQGRPLAALFPSAARARGRSCYPAPWGVLAGASVDGGALGPWALPDPFTLARRDRPVGTGRSHFQFRMSLKPGAEPSLLGDRTDGSKGVRHGPRSGRFDHASIAHRSGEPPRRRPPARFGARSGDAVAARVWYMSSAAECRGRRAHLRARPGGGRYRCAHGATAQPARRGCTANRRDARGNLRILVGARAASCRVRHAGVVLCGLCVHPGATGRRPWRSGLLVLIRRAG